MVDDSLRQRLAAELAEADPCCGLTHADDYAAAALAVFATWLRERAEGARFIAETAPDDEAPTVVATWGGARAALNALADEIDPKGGDRG